MSQNCKKKWCYQLKGNKSISCIPTVRTHVVEEKESSKCIKMDWGCISVS